VISRKGHEVLRRGLPWLRAVERLDVELVPELEYSARPQFLRGDFETAAFVAMKEVEVQVRAKAGLSNDLVGTALMQQAFRPAKNAADSGGPLYRATLEGGESQAQVYLSLGAIGLFKNPSSHLHAGTDSTRRRLPATRPIPRRVRLPVRPHGPVTARLLRSAVP
jgi:uncharacterized protein (TIGR02391 family)